MKIAILGSAGSLPLAPMNDPSWKIWGCSPGVYPFTGPLNAWFELHRWEPGIPGKPATQKPWFSPEYVQWMSRLGCPVWMKEHVAEIPTSRALPIDDLVSKYGSYFFTSSVSIMIACAIEDILEMRAANAAAGVTTLEPDTIGLWGVDMSANEEYGYQRAGCQHFLLLAGDLGIRIYVPPESDLLRPMPIYGLCESEHWHIKMLAHQRELQARKERVEHMVEEGTKEKHFVLGALDELAYHMQTWGETREGIGTNFDIQARSPRLRSAVQAQLEAEATNAPTESLEKIATAGMTLKTDAEIARAPKPKRRSKPKRR